MTVLGVSLRSPLGGFGYVDYGTTQSFGKIIFSVNSQSRYDDGTEPPAPSDADGNDDEQLLRYRAWTERLWRRVEEELSVREEGACGPRVLRLYYEDWAAAPEAVLCRLIAFLGLPPPDRHALAEMLARASQSAPARPSAAAPPVHPFCYLQS